MTKIHSLHGTTVAEIFSTGLDNLEQIEAIAVSVLWMDGTVTAGRGPVRPLSLRHAPHGPPAWRARWRNPGPNRGLAAAVARAIHQGHRHARSRMVQCSIHGGVNQRPLGDTGKGQDCDAENQQSEIPQP